jgi:hypothetical protein
MPITKVAQVVEKGIARWQVQGIVFLFVVVFAILSVAFFYYMLPSSTETYLPAAVERQTRLPDDQKKPVPELRKEYRQRASERVWSVMGSFFAPLITIIITVVLSSTGDQFQEKLDGFKSLIAMSVFLLIQVFWLVLFTSAVQTTAGDLTEFQSDPVFGTLFLSIQAVIVAFVFPKGDSISKDPPKDPPKEPPPE